MAGDAATNAAARVKPSHEDLNQIDTPAADNTWHEAPDFKQGKEEMKNKLGSYYKGNPKEDAKAVAAEGTSTAHPTGSSDPRDLAATAAREQAHGGSTGINAVGGAQAAANAAKRQLDANLDQEAKDKAKAKKDEYRARTKDYFSKKMPQERREQTIWRLKVSPVEHHFCFFRSNMVCRKWFWSASSIPIITPPSPPC